MKKYFILTLTWIATITLGCDPDRVDTPPLAATEAIYFSNLTQFRTAMIGVYAKIHDDYFFNVPGFGNWASSLWLLPGDDITETNGTRTAEELFDGGMNSTNERISWVFDKTYELIQKANVVIEKVQTVDYSDFEGADEIEMMEGEALFLRGLAYFKLFNIYGSVPVVTERLESGQTNTPKSTSIEVLDQVIEDCMNALPILPESWSDVNRGRATKNSARGLLVKALVFRGNYTGESADMSEAINFYNEITAGLQDRFLDNFDALEENNGESLFEFQSSTASALDNIFLYNDGPWRGVENLTVYRGMFMPSGGFGSLAGTRFVVTDKLLNTFGTDPRINYFLQADDGYEGKVFQKYTLPELNQVTIPFEGSLNNERILRMADIELLIAEAFLKTGNTGNAITHINVVRTRARDWAITAGLDASSLNDRSTGESNENTIMQWIMDERFVELAGEGQRWWDLKRWHMSGDIDLTGWDGNDSGFSSALASPSQFDVGKHLLFPIPQSEIDRNEAITENNPGY